MKKGLREAVGLRVVEGVSAEAGQDGAGCDGIGRDGVGHGGAGHDDAAHGSIGRQAGCLQRGQRHHVARCVGGAVGQVRWREGARQAQRGLTLFELLVGLSIVALLATLAVPGFAGLKRSAGMSSAANELLWALQWARSSAGMKGSPVTVCLTRDDHTCIGTPDIAAVGWLVFEAGAAAGGAGALPPAMILHAFHLPADVTVTATRPAVTFWPVARSGMTSTFELCDVSSRNAGRSIVVSQTGRPRVSPEPASCAG